jgi:hypothetical protein
MQAGAVIARLFDRLLWRTPRQRARRLAVFAGVERSSATDLRLAARACSSPERAVAYLRHARDELRHTQLFFGSAAAIAAQHGLSQPAQPSAACEGLFERLGELDFLAFVHLAERRGREQFEIHARTHAAQDRAELAQMFEAIIADERHHERYSGKLLLELAGNERAAAERVAAMRRWELRRAFVRLAHANGAALFSFAAGVLYVLVTPLRLLLPRERGRALSSER